MVFFIFYHYDNSPNYIESFREKVKRLFTMYREFVVRSDYVPRSGYYLCNIYPKPNWRATQERAQSDTEHAYSAMWWAENISMAFSDVRELVLYREDCVRTLMIHDLFESKIGGDIPDVDTRCNIEKDAEEYQYMLEYVRLYPNPIYRSRMEKRFFEFQSKETEFGQICYSFDKIDAVLRALAYEIDGKSGVVGGRGFESDERSIEFTGTKNVVDNWFYSSVVSRILKYDCGEFFVRFVEEAIRYERGKDIPWMSKVDNYQSWK